MTSEDPIVIVGARRTPMGAFQGALGGLCCPQLGAAAIRGALEQAGLAADDADELVINEVLMGCVLPAGLGQAPARQAALGAGLAESTPCTTVNKMCGSGMKAIMQAFDALRLGSAEHAIAGGMESMSNAPYLLPKARAGLRMGHAQMLDHMFLDGLEDAYEPGRLMGTYAEECAEAFGFTREAQDDYAIASLTRARRAIESGAFASEIVALEAPAGRGTDRVEYDEAPYKANIDRIAQLKPAFRDGGTVTAANSSSISDGAAALVLMRQREAERLGLTPLARLHGHVSHAMRPGDFPVAPIHAIRKLHERLGWSRENVDLYEINEAFAVVAMAAMRELGLDPPRVNVHGGACALGHPIGASGARIVVTLLNALAHHGMTRGVAAICIGGGEATAIGIERLT